MKDEREDAAENSGENTRRGRLENIERYQWQKGQPSPNPGGRPRKAPISDAYLQMIGQRLPDETRRALRLAKGSTWAHAMAAGQLRSAVKGNTPAAKEIADRVEGRVPLPVNLDADEYQDVHVVIEHVGSMHQEE